MKGPALAAGLALALAAMGCGSGASGDDDTGSGTGSGSGDADGDSDGDGDTDGDADGDSDTGTGTEPGCAIPDQPGFNHYTIAAINDASRYPKDGTYPYCWESTGDTCGGHWGMVHDGAYGGDVLFDGGGDCFCSGHTLEIFLRAYQLWLEDNGVAEGTPFTCGSHTLGEGAIDPYGDEDGVFYQYWQGYGVTSEASSADAFEWAGIGENLYEADWDDVLPGDYVNLSRSTGSGHAVIFVDWIEEGGAKVGLRYYGCNGSGESCPDPDDPLNSEGNSGPSYNTELFEGSGGTVLPEALFVGRAFLPTI
jgi:hypothetical protein